MLPRRIADEAGRKSIAEIRHRREACDRPTVLVRAGAITGVTAGGSAMQREFDRGYDRQPYRSLVADYPDESVYPIDSFRVD